MPHILILEDERPIADSLVFVLEQEGFTTHWESLAAKALDYADRKSVDLVIMDVGLPDLTGFEACKQLRRKSDVPVIFLTARGDELDRVVGLEIGADDYVVKPFSPREVAARVKAILKRVNGQQASPAAAPAGNAGVSHNPASDHEFAIDPERKAIFFHQQLLTLTRLEFNLLQVLVAQPERVFTREQLLSALGIAAEAGYDRNIDGHIKAVRAKLRAVKPDTEAIKTLRGFGYAYQPEGRDAGRS